MHRRQRESPYHIPSTKRCTKSIFSEHLHLYPPSHPVTTNWRFFPLSYIINVTVFLLVIISTWGYVRHFPSLMSSFVSLCSSQFSPLFVTFLISNLIVSIRSSVWRVCTSAYRSSFGSCRLLQWSTCPRHRLRQPPLITIGGVFLLAKRKKKRKKQRRRNYCWKKTIAAASQAMASSQFEQRRPGAP